MTVKLKFIILAIILTILALLITGYKIGHSRRDNASQAVIDAQNKEIQRYQAEIDDKTVYISRIEQEIKTLRQAKKDGDVTNEELKKLNLKNVSEINRITLLVDSLLSVDHSGEVVVITKYVNVRDSTQNAIVLPFSFTKSDKWLSLKGNFDNDGKLGINLKLSAEVDVISGIDKDTKKRTVSLLTDNPYIKTLGIKSFKVDEKKPTRYGIGFNAGYGITRNGLSPFVGIGLSYNLIRF